MEWRIFQIIFPLISLLFIVNLISKYFKTKLTFKEALVSFLFWLSLAVFALFPDPISNFLADLLGIKSNVNAIIFFGLAVLIYAQFQLYYLIKKQERKITQLTRHLALKDFEKEEQ